MSVGENEVSEKEWVKRSEWLTPESKLGKEGSGNAKWVLDNERVMYYGLEDSVDESLA